MTDTLMELIKSQRNQAMDAAAMLQAQLIEAQREIARLNDALAKAHTPSPTPQHASVSNSNPTDE